MAKNPYQGLPENAYWRTAVAAKDRFEIDALWTPKFHVRPKHNVSTFGSCFAQHIGRALSDRGFNWLITEAAPCGMVPADKIKFNYDLFSCRTGNIYTASLLRQWVKWAVDPSSVPNEIWEMNGRFYDPFRPNIEPDGFLSADEVQLSRLNTIKAFRACIEKSAFFVFTLGLTESWFHKDGFEYPMCPGTVVGTFNPDLHFFVNQSYRQNRRELSEAIKLMRGMNPRLRFILTVSPIPLAATKSGQHVLVATLHSKSILRTVAGAAAQSRIVDYFPSYEIISSPVFNGEFFSIDKRRVTDHGISFVMDTFFKSQEATFGKIRTVKKFAKHKRFEEVCEEHLLSAFE